jgi:hypothetical protein
MDVRTSDIRVSERVCMSSITIDRFSTVYNDLKDEVSAIVYSNLEHVVRLVINLMSNLRPYNVVVQVLTENLIVLCNNIPISKVLLVKKINL